MDQAPRRSRGAPIAAGGLLAIGLLISRVAAMGVLQERQAARIARNNKEASPGNTSDRAARHADPQLPAAANVEGDGGTDISPRPVGCVELHRRG